MHRTIARVFAPFDHGLSLSSAFSLPYARLSVPRRSLHRHQRAFLGYSMGDMDKEFDQLGEMESRWREFPRPASLGNMSSNCNSTRMRAIEVQGTNNINSQNGESLVTFKDQRQLHDTNRAIGEMENEYTMSVHVGEAFLPEDIQISFQNGMMTIEAKTEQKSQDGYSSVYQEFSKQFTFPANVDLKKVKFQLTPDGILRIEAPLPQNQHQQAIPEPPKSSVIPI